MIFELVNLSGKIPCLAVRASLLSFSLFLRSVLKFYSVGTSLRNFDLYFSKRWSFIFSDTCLTWRGVNRVELIPKLYAFGFPRSRFSEVLMALSLARHIPTVVQHNSHSKKAPTEGTNTHRDLKISQEALLQSEPCTCRIQTVRRGQVVRIRATRNWCRNWCTTVDCGAGMSVTGS